MIFNLENKMHSNKTQETRDTKNFPQGKHKGEKPTTSSEIEWAPMADSFSSLTHVPQWVSVCVINREDHSLFIFFRSLESHSNMLASLNDYLLDSTSLGASNNPSAPQLVGTFPPPTNKDVYLNTMVGTIAPTYNDSHRVNFSRIVL